MIAVAACNSTSGAPPNEQPVYGRSGTLGQGTARSYAELNADGSPVRIGIVFTPEVLERLPKEPNRVSRCFDANDNRSHDAGECIGDYEVILSLPQDVIRNPKIPIQWAAMGWNAHGHMPPAWTVPHFDFHFYTVRREEVQAIRTGACGEKIDCTDFQRATKAVPARLLTLTEN